MLSVVLKSECGTGKLSLSLFVLFSCCSRYVAFFNLIHLNDLLVYQSSYVVRCLAMLTIFDQSEAYKSSQIHTHTPHTNRESTYSQALLYEQRLQKGIQGTFICSRKFVNVGIFFKPENWLNETIGFTSILGLYEVMINDDWNTEMCLMLNVKFKVINRYCSS